MTAFLALQKAEQFIADELECRRVSYLPDPEPEEAESLRQAEEALAEVQAAIREMEASVC